MIVDAQGRRFQKLRVSLTSGCNYACTYCVPNGKKLAAQHDALPLGEMLQAVAYLKEVSDLRVLRITGGEPLISPHFDDFVQTAGRMGFEDISLTTNGHLLERKLGLLLSAGMRRINVSLDSLDEDVFRKVTRGGDLRVVLKGIVAAREAGMGIKMNMVPMRGQNHHQIIPLMNFCLANDIELRVIELMRMGHLAHDFTNFSQQFYGMSDILASISQCHDFVPVESEADSTSQRFEIPGKGFFGVIANESAPFCRGCSRLRLSSNGWLYGCLSSSNRHYIGTLLELPHEQALSSLRSLLVQALADKQDSSFVGDVMVMKIIGG